MKELEQFLNVEAEWVLEKLSSGTESNDRNYYQGRLDQLAQVRRYLAMPQLMREGAHTECAYCEAGIAEQHLAERASK
jgi:hypothetical protein